MKRNTLKEILNKYYSNDGTKSILNGRRKPSYEAMLKMNEKHKVPFTAWKDIKSFISSNNNNNKDSNIKRV